MAHVHASEGSFCVVLRSCRERLHEPGGPQEFAQSRVGSESINDALPLGTGYCKVYKGLLACNGE
jgi:hypothetical protein